MDKINKVFKQIKSLAESKPDLELFNDFEELTDTNIGSFMVPFIQLYFSFLHIKQSKDKAAKELRKLEEGIMKSPEFEMTEQSICEIKKEFDMSYDKVKYEDDGVLDLCCELLKLYTD